MVKIGLCWRLKDPEGLREFDLGVVELLYCWSVATSDCDLLHLHDLDWVGAVTLGNGAVVVRSRYSWYMLWVPLRES